MALQALHDLTLEHLLLLLDVLLLCVVGIGQPLLDLVKLVPGKLHLLLTGLDALEFAPLGARHAVFAADLVEPLAVEEEVDGDVHGQGGVELTPASCTTIPALSCLPARHNVDPPDVVGQA